MRLSIRNGVRLAAIAASLALAAAVSQPAFAAGDWGPIINGGGIGAGSGLCLQPLPTQSQNINDAGVRIAQEPCANNSQDPNYLPQQWHKVSKGTSNGHTYYYMINQSSGECMDVTNANTADYAPIQQYYCNGGGSEMWITYKYDFGTFQYTNLRTSKCLDIPGATTSPTYIQQYHCTSSNTAQAFNVPPGT